MDSKRVINNSIALLVMDLSSKIFPLVTFPWIVRALGPESYGKVGFAAAVAGFFGLLASPGLQPTVFVKPLAPLNHLEYLLRN